MSWVKESRSLAKESPGVPSSFSWCVFGKMPIMMFSAVSSRNQDSNWLQWLGNISSHLQVNTKTVGYRSCWFSHSGVQGPRFFSILPSVIPRASVLRLLLLYFQMINTRNKKRGPFLPFLSFGSPNLFQEVPSKFTVTSYWLLWGHMFILNCSLIGDWDYPWANQIHSLCWGWV